MPSPTQQDAASWSPGTYLRFGAQRLRPAIDLLAGIPLRSAKSIADLGCGTGAVFAALLERFPDASLEGVDSSASMLEQAQELIRGDEFLRHPAPRLTLQGIEQWVRSKRRSGTLYDLIYSNAALHWVDQHEVLLPQLALLLEPGGVLAVQMPRNWGHASHALMRRTLKTLGSARATEILCRLQRQPVAEASWYHSRLKDLCGHLDLWETVYYHQFEQSPADGADSPVLDWVSSTALRPVLSALAAEQATLDLFLERYNAALARAYPPDAAGTVLFPFHRLFVIAQRRSPSASSSP